MPRRTNRRQLLHWSVWGLAAAGCGTIMYPERRGQPSGRLDTRVVALDAIGLIFFFVPGVVAFAVDFATGSIYLPSESYGQAGKIGVDQLAEVECPPDELTTERIEAVTSEYAGRPVRLAEARRQPLASLAEFPRLYKLWHGESATG